MADVRKLVEHILYVVKGMEEREQGEEAGMEKVRAPQTYYSMFDIFLTGLETFSHFNCSQEMGK